MRCFCTGERQTSKHSWRGLPTCHVCRFRSLESYATVKLCTWLACVAFAGPIVADEVTPQDFDRHIAPLIAQRCLTCHSGSEPKGKFDLSSRTTAMAGGESGVAIKPGSPEESLFWENIDSDQMPPKKPLSAAEKANFKTWIEGGAHWGTEKIDPFRYSTDARAGSDWWSLQPLRNPQPPTTTRPGWTSNPIDAFVDSKLQAAGLAPSNEADKRTLIRRLSFDLLGLPPTPEEINKFLTDTSDVAYENLVDRVLASPHYGERWARHWLDVVRFGESNGFEYDQPRNHAWPYRNWVIDALNQDMPYDEFVRMQLAGDILQPNNFDAITATGFLVAGPHNTTLPANDKMRMSMAQDEIEDLVGIVGQTFLGLTANCARCHDHKFDPISQKEYYQLAATLTGVTHGERSVQVELSAEHQQRVVDIESELSKVRTARDAIEQAARSQILAERKDGTAAPPEPPIAMTTWEFEGDLRDSVGSITATAHGSARIEDGCLVLDGKDAWVGTQPFPVDLQEKTLEAWVQLDSLDQSGGGAISVQTLDGATFDAIVFGEREPRKWMAGSNGFVRTMPFNGTEEVDARDRAVHFAIVYHKDGSITGYRDGTPHGKSYRPGDLHTFAAEKFQVIFGLRHSPVGGNRMLAGRIQRAQLYNRALTADEVAASAGVADRNYVSSAQMLARLSPEQRAHFDTLITNIATLQTEKDALTGSQLQKLYACVSNNPGITRVLNRGDVGSPAEEVSPAGLGAVTGGSTDFGLAPNASDADRRLKLAAWVTHPDNPLFARVMLNRLWQYHFGQGMVTTPSDFGFNGGQPSHPDLLDWLAQAFRSGGYRLKPIHRLMVTSATYRQSSAPNAAAAQIDADNRLLWRKTPQRLEAEEIRDAVLVSTGQLNSAIGGVGYRDVRHFEFKGSNFYESVNETGPEALRRTIYRFSPRGGRNPFLDTFDCPDPSVTTPRRAATTTPLQALALMNNALVFTLADNFADRLQREAGETTATQVKLVYLVAYGREADQQEVQLASRFVDAHGLASFCRVILNSNEFLYVQ